MGRRRRGGGGGDVSQSEIREGSKRTNQSAVVRSFGTCNFGPIFFLGNLHHLSGDAPRRYLVRSLVDRGSRRERGDPHFQVWRWTEGYRAGKHGPRSTDSYRSDRHSFPPEPKSQG